jgi:hypothetical protein
VIAQCNSAHPPPDALEETVAVLHMLTSFETFDALAVPDRSPQDVAPRCTGSPSQPSGCPSGEVLYDAKRHAHTTQGLLEIPTMRLARRYDCEDAGCRPGSWPDPRYDWPECPLG